MILRALSMQPSATAARPPPPPPATATTPSDATPAICSDGQAQGSVNGKRDHGDGGDNEGDQRPSRKKGGRGGGISMYTSISESEAPSTASGVAAGSVAVSSLCAPRLAAGATAAVVPGSPASPLASVAAQETTTATQRVGSGDMDVEESTMLAEPIAMATWPPAVPGVAVPPTSSLSSTEQPAVVGINERRQDRISLKIKIPAAALKRSSAKRLSANAPSTQAPAPAPVAAPRTEVADAERAESTTRLGLGSSAVPWIFAEDTAAAVTVAPVAACGSRLPVVPLLTGPDVPVVPAAVDEPSLAAVSCVPPGKLRR